VRNLIIVGVFFVFSGLVTSGVEAAPGTRVAHAERSARVTHRKPNWPAQKDKGLGRFQREPGNFSVTHRSARDKHPMLRNLRRAAQAGIDLSTLAPGAKPRWWHIPTGGATRGQVALLGAPLTLAGLIVLDNSKGGHVRQAVIEFIQTVFSCHSVC
jgi:hypothetical protein